MAGQPEIDGLLHLPSPLVGPRQSSILASAKVHYGGSSSGPGHRPACHQIVQQPLTLASMAAPKSKCSKCGKRARYGRFAMCRNCLVLDGAIVCSLCGRIFRPTGREGRKTRSKCPTCRRSKGKEVYVVGQAGSPGLGKRS